MKKWLYSVVCAATIASMTGCSLIGTLDSKDDKPVVAVAIEDGEDAEPTPVIVKEERKVIEGDWGYLELVETKDPWLYVTDINMFEEFGDVNEGGAVYKPSEQLIAFGITRSDGTQTGTVEGPYVYAEMDIASGEVTVKEFKAAAGGALIELDDARLAEICTVFLEIFKDNL